MSESSENLLVQLLIKAGYFSEEEYEQVLKKKPVHDTSIRHYLVQKELVTEKQILSVLCQEQGYPIADILDFHPDALLIAKIPFIHVSTYQIFPLRQEGDHMVIGMVDVLDSHVIDDLRFCFETPFRIELISPAEHNMLLEKYYKDEKESYSSESVTLNREIEAEDEKEDPSINDAPVVVLLNNILIQAVNDHASDLHFEPFEDEFKIRYRIDGTLYEMIPPPKNLAISVLSRIKVMAKMNIAEKRVPQDGRIALTINGKPVDLRVSTIPTAFGESAVLRVLDRSHIELELDKLGMSIDMIRKIRNIIFKPNGIFIATGPTGAGKTTTLYSCLKEINTIDSKVITTEDPVEYEIDGITQVAIKEPIGLTFAACLRSILRQDPDRIMVGEIRDLPTMNMAIQASLTGHLVLTTLHTNDAASAITRLIDMGVEPFLICSSLEAILAQRLIRKICSNCKTPFEMPQSMLTSFGLDPKVYADKQFFKGTGCDQCNGIGYKGRVGIFELLFLTDEIRNLIMNRATAHMIKETAIRMGMTTLFEDGMRKVESGITSVEEVILWMHED